MARAVAAALAGALLIVGFITMTSRSPAPTAGAPADQGVAVAAPAPTAGAAVAPTAASRAAASCIYLVRGVKKAAGLYVGDFLVLRRTGANMRGYGGSFYSEGYDVRATITGRRVRIESGDPYQPGMGESVTRKWVESQDRIAGWKRVSRATMRKYSGGFVPVSGRVCA